MTIRNSRVLPLFNFERLDMLRDSIRHPRKMLLSFELANRFNIQFRASRYVTGLNQTSEKKVIVVWISSELQHSIWSISIYYETISDIRVKSYCRLNLLRASVFNFERLDILRDEDMTKSKGKDPLEGLGGPMTRARARKAKEALQQVMSVTSQFL